MILPLLLALSMQATSTVELYKGATIPGISPRYWEVEDTTLDSTGADENHGWQSELDGGEGKTILIQFKDLNRVLGPHKKIVRATLGFTIVSGAKVDFAGIGQVLSPWNEGPERNLLDLNPSGPAVAGAAGSATWRHRRLGLPNGGWEQVGAIGQNDSTPLSQAVASQPDVDHFSIDHLENVVEQEYEHPETDHGFVLQFKSPVAFASSKAASDRPALSIEYEAVPPALGPDLTVAYIERRPEYERYENTIGFITQNQDGAPIPVLDHPQNALTQKWPQEGEELTYVAHVKNVGDAPSSGFTARWFLDEQPGPTSEDTTVLAPNQETLVPLKLPFKLYASDHRLGRISLTITPKGVDMASANKSLEIQQDALNIGVFVEKTFYDKASQVATAVGSHSFDDWIQEQIGLMNDVYFPFSRFSFAPDGALERIRIQRISVVPDGSLNGPQDLPNGSPDLNYDAELGFPAGDAKDLNAIGPSADLSLLRRLGLQLGFIDLSTTSIMEGDSRLASVADQALVERGFSDPYPGLMGGGDTRDDTRLLPTQALNYEPYPDPEVEVERLQATDLLSASDVSELQTDLGKRRGFQGDFLYDSPPMALLNATDYNGDKIRNIDLIFYQMVNGGFGAGTRSFKVTTNDDGIANLFRRDVLAGPGDKLLIGHTLAPNPFGRIDYQNRNGMFLIKAVVNGVTEWATLKAWQLADCFHRGQNSAALLHIEFNLPTQPLDSATDLAKGKTITASTGSDLSGLLDGTNSKETALPSEQGSWVEIDLGRDWTVGEVRLITRSGSFWKRFQLATYETGQKPTDAEPWAQETDWPWAFANRYNAAGGNRSVAYRGIARRFRYLRIVNTDGGPGELRAIQVVPARASAP